MASQFDGKVALVTGGSSGISKATAICRRRQRFAIAFGKAGAKVVVAARRELIDGGYVAT